ncbi:MAG: LamG-like jellyroll fold domain-containing protein [Candidatus Paceibacterota bacterium]|jgi:prepilin-type N-terminal cleavage/methylation domain-containing protein
MKQKAFTLIELLVVIAIVGILSSVIYTNITGLRDRARVTAGIRFDSSTLHSIGDQLVGEWTFDSPGLPLIDTSGFGNTGTCTACPTYATTSGYNNKGVYSFDGEDDLIRITKSSSIDIFKTNKWTISWWANISGTGDPNQDFFNGTPHKPRIFTNIAVRNINLSAFVGGSYTNLASTPNYVYKLDQWTHFVVEADTDKYRIFVNGVEVKNASYIQIDPLVDYFCIIFPGWDAGFKGLVDDVRLYSSSLSSSDIQKLYADGISSHEVATK